MTRRIWKYEIPVDDQDHQIPFWPIHVAAKSDDHAVVVVWCEVELADGEQPATEAHRVFGTGHPLPDGASHRGTVQSGPFVWHLYNTELCT